MEEYNNSNFTDTNNNTTVETKFGMGLEDLGKDIFDTKHMARSLVVFWGTIFLIVGGAVCCWLKYFRNGETSDDDPENNELRLDETRRGSRRDTLILNLRRQSRRDTLILPFTLH